MEKPLKNPWARFRGEVMHISSVDASVLERRVETDPRRDFVCPRTGCGDFLFPRGLESASRRAHFVHRTQDCGLNRETLLHVVAKLEIAAQRYLWIPELRAHPDRPDSDIVEGARRMECADVRTEERLLGKYRADLTLTGQSEPFAILGDENDLPVIVEIVVSAPVSREKVDAVQKAGYRMMAIVFERDDVADANLANRILRNAHREWLAHPDWMDIRRRQWDRIERERMEAERAEAERVRIILERIKAGRTPEWTARREKAILRFVKDHDLQDHVGIPGSFDHWMAGDPLWWQATLLKKMVFDRIGASYLQTDVVIPPAIDCLDAIEDFVIPFAKEERDPRVLAAVNVGSEGWGTPEAVVAGYLRALASAKFSVRAKGGARPSRRYAEIGVRTKQIHNELVHIHQAAERGVEETEILIHEWKDLPYFWATRREAIIRGGSEYDAVLHQAVMEGRQARRTAYGHELVDQMPATARPKAMETRRPSPEPKRALAAVVERGGSEPALHARPRGPAVTEDSPVGGPGADFYRDELQRSIERHFRVDTRNRMRAGQLAQLFMDQRHPVLGSSPRAYCMDHVTMQTCQRLAGIKF